MAEARLEESAGAKVPTGEGWFVVNVRDATWRTNEKFGSGCRFESMDAPFQQLGINLRVLEPGQPACLYHAESQQEDFLVLHGECVLLVEGEERPLKAWDFVHCPPMTEHVFVGAGDGPCVILMAGARHDEERLVYPVSDVAAEYGASVEREVYTGEEAYAPFPRTQPGRPRSWSELPWSAAG